MNPETKSEKVEFGDEAILSGAGLSRRQFLVFSGSAITALMAMHVCRAWGADTPVIIIDNAKGLLISDPSRCVGCQRCELACTEFNDGRAQPSLAICLFSAVGIMMVAQNPPPLIHQF